MESNETTLSKYFEKGFYFSCKKCGDCCRGLDGGEVYLYREDIINLVHFLNKRAGKRRYSLKSFVREYVKVLNTTFYWKEPGAKRGKNYSFKTLGFRFTGKDEHCKFINEKNECTVHKSRPFQCRAFPIGWNMIVKNVRNFQKYTRDCPALKESLNEEGKFYTREEIIDWIEKEYELIINLKELLMSFSQQKYRKEFKTILDVI
ncbi:MAG: YkgJ family cysteine cluster protein [Candidatus Lokiarchaeota archaeon]